MAAFAGKMVLVTGASSGIGFATAVRLAQQGAYVIAAARRKPNLDALMVRIEETGGVGSSIVVDISVPDSVEAMFDRIERDFARLDGAINNAALESEFQPLQDILLDHFETLFNTNVRGAWLCMRREMRIMLKQRKGSIVNVASIAGLHGYAGLSAYSASKHAVVGLTKSAAAECAVNGVRVNCLCPGGAKTEMAARYFERVPEGEALAAADIPMKRLGAPHELAEAAIWLLSDAASFVTGATLLVDGGRASSL